MKAPAPTNLDLHLREWWRQFLPLVVVVATAVSIVFVMLRKNSQAPDPSHPFFAGSSHLGLLNTDPGAPFDPAFALVGPIDMARAPAAAVVDPPMGGEHASLTYNAQPFFTNHHLGDDINGIGGQNSDLGDPLFAIGDGAVIYAGWAGDGWGHVVILLHQHPDGTLYESFYGHLDQIRVSVGQRLTRGDQLGTVGTANGRYLAHLHFELRTYPTLDVGLGYSDQRSGRVPGELSLLRWRQRPDDRIGVPPLMEKVAPELEMRMESQLPPVIPLLGPPGEE